MTDEVIITDERIAHVKERHPKDYNKVLEYIEVTLQDPDYIFKDDRQNTGLIIKQMKNRRENVQIVLRIHTSKDEEGYKNSIISYWKISSKRLENYLRNKKLIYKKE